MRPRRVTYSQDIRGLIHVGSRQLFPINWLQKQDYCEYQIYLENVKGLQVKPTAAMTVGSQGHDQLYNQFAISATPATAEEMLTESKVGAIYSREFQVLDLEHGIYGLIDEIWITPEGFIVIDDKPGTKAYSSNIHQVYGYCLAYRGMISRIDNRRIIGALRERGTSNIYWQSPFDEEAVEEIRPMVKRIHNLLQGIEEFSSTDNQNKCQACRFNTQCDRRLL